jgi:hypothetical protein
MKLGEELWLIFCVIFFVLKSVSNCPSDVSEQAAITEHAFFGNWFDYRQDSLTIRFE